MAKCFLSALSRPWDSFEAYLFDIDGTLISSEDAVHYFAFCAALKHLSGKPLNLDGVIAHGNTDRGILRDALVLNEIPAQMWRPRLSEACAEMGRFVTDCKADLRVTLLPGVRQVLGYLHARGATLGVATGNLEVIGKLKLEAAGISAYFTDGSYSDASEYRADVFRIALSSVRQRLGESASCCIIGDTPADIRAAHANETDCLAVATGIYRYEELILEEPNGCCETLSALLPSLTPNEDRSAAMS